MVDFEVINHKEGTSSYPALVGWPQGWKKKATISLEKDHIKLKGKGKRIIILLSPMEGKPWIEPDDDDVNVQWLYQVIQWNEDIVEPNKEG